MAMTIILVFAAFNPFFNGNFTAACGGADGLFENPAALGRHLVAENMLTYAHDSLCDRLALNRIGFGVVKHGSVYTGEAAVSLNPPGVFAVGYAIRFGISGGRSSTVHYLGALARLGTMGAAGFRTDAFEDTLHMSGGIAIDGLTRFLALAWDGEYETRSSEFDCHWGVQVRFTSSINCSFQAARDVSDWHAGIGLGYKNINLAGTYSARNGKLGLGVLISIYPVREYIQ